MNPTSSILDQPIVLCLNAGWQRIDTKTVQEAIVAMNSANDASAKSKAFHGMNIEYAQAVNGLYDFSKPEHIYPVPWREWIELPIRPYDEVIRCSGGRLVRVPTVIISTSYHKMPRKTKRLTKAAIYERDGGKCQYTGRQLTRKEATIDHVMPKSRGGRDTWENWALAAPEVNFEKADRTPAEAGLTLLRKPSAPTALPVSAFIREARHNDWKIFMDN
jgi:5-methylcytosine-specific restriction endonuclease McrA